MKGVLTRFWRERSFRPKALKCGPEYALQRGLDKVSLSYSPDVNHQVVHSTAPSSIFIQRVCCPSLIRSPSRSRSRSQYTFTSAVWSQVRRTSLAPVQSWRIVNHPREAPQTTQKSPQPTTHRTSQYAGGNAQRPSCNMTLYLHILPSRAKCWLYTHCSY